MTLGFRFELRALLAVAATGLLVLTLVPGSGASHAPVPSGALRSSAVDFFVVHTTSSFSFVPDQISVTPGARVQLEVIQDDVTNHTFLLSSVANLTISPGDSTAQLFAFLHTDPPLVNLSVPGTVGSAVFKNFTAPAFGTYEFFCEIEGHFQNGMKGFLYSGTSLPSSGSPGLNLFSPLVLGGVIGAAIVIVALIVVAVRLRSRRTPPTVATPPKGPGST